jgi:hypothetical protein
MAHAPIVKPPGICRTSISLVYSAQCPRLRRRKASKFARSSGAETKKLLRAAMRGLLPDSILAPRTKRTGVTEGYFARSMREQLPAMVDSAFEHSLLESAGVIDAMEFKRAVREYARGVQSNFSVGLYFTLQTELWLRSHVAVGTSSALTEAPSLRAAVRAEQ